jgi:Polyketide cyclase / dehydrase and lipid transport
MASIRKEIVIDAAAADAWDAVRDVGAVHTRLARGFVTATRLEPGARVVTFVNGFEARELIVDVDDAQRRIAYSVVGGSVKHHNASMQILEEGARRSRMVWITDVLPNEAAAQLATMIDQGAEAMRRTLSGT